LRIVPLDKNNFFTSYAQNFEDILLWRALKNIKKGFYIDIGAQDPEEDSISLGFYEKGWRGVHIEPNEYYCNLLRIARPDEIVEQIAISNQRDFITFYEFPFTGLSTASFATAKNYKEKGFDFIKKDVKTSSLDFIFDKYSLNIVHWLKIDVEGLEKSVLDSWKNSKCRPWIIVIESTKPLTQIENYSSWEGILLDKKYSFVYFDGLNRFYIHYEHIELAEHFKVPINIFDNFLLSGKASHNFHRLFTEKAKESEAKAKESEAKAKESEAKAKESEAKANAIYNSRSWRITAPIRITFKKARALLKMTKNIKTTIKTKTKLFLADVRLYVIQRPRVRRYANTMLSQFPALKMRLTKLAAKETPNVLFTDKLTMLKPRARQIYENLKLAEESRSKEKSQ